MAVVLHLRTTACRVDEHRCIAGHRAHDGFGEANRVCVEPGVNVQSSATVSAPSGETHRRARRPNHSGRSSMHVSLPRIHHTTGVEPYVDAARVGSEPFSSDREPRRQTNSAT